MRTRASSLALILLFLGCGSDKSESGPTPVDAGEDVPEDQEPVCGNKVKERVEQCDDGNRVNGDGCENDCTFTCTATNAKRCDDGNPCNGVETCSATNSCVKGTPLAAGASCGTGKICLPSGACAEASCGDGVVSGTEECDDGNAVDGDGCNASCKFSCVSSDSARNCTTASPGICSTGGTCNDSTHTCSGGTLVADGSSCGPGKVCKGSVCESPATEATCGNGTRDPGEHCDDGAKDALDGCDPKCRLEQTHRFNSIKVQWATDTWCTQNALGGAIGAAGQDLLQRSLDDSVAAGETNVLFQFLALDDLTGTADPSVELGAFTATHIAGSGYSGLSDLDWWYRAEAETIDSARAPLAKIAAKIESKLLTAGPGRVDVKLSFGGAPVRLNLSEVRISGNIGPASKPLSSFGSPPGHVSSEKVDPAMLTFTSVTNGQLCGRVSAESLSNAPAPPGIVEGGPTPCAEGYTTSSSLLDVLVGGCRIAGGLIVAIAPTQPDGVDAGATAAGAGAPYTLAAGTDKAVASCKDRTGATVSLSACLAAASYSSYFKWTSGRVIVKP